jgi:hypothetical protein
VVLPRLLKSQQIQKGTRIHPHLQIVTPLPHRPGQTAGPLPPQKGRKCNTQSGNTDLFLSISGLLFAEGFAVLGAPFHYQFESSFGRDSKWDVPVALYLHSRIDKNYDGLYLLVKYSVIGTQA